MSTDKRLDNIIDALLALAKHVDGDKYDKYTFGPALTKVMEGLKYQVPNKNK